MVEYRQKNDGGNDMEKLCWIFCALEPGDIRLRKEPGDLVIAADRGYAHAKKAGIAPDLILGDFDSLGEVPPEDGVLVFPKEKDYTDAWLAVAEGKKRGFARFCLFGALGGRIDHSAANLQLLSSLAGEGKRGYLLGDGYAASVIGNGELRFAPRPDGRISVFAFGGDAVGVTIEGLKYALSDGKLDTAFPLGVSNEFCGKSARVAVKDGQILVLWEQDAAMFDPRSETL